MVSASSRREDSTGLQQLRSRPALTEQSARVAALTVQGERPARNHGGFLSASVQVSDNARRVLNYLRWQTREDGEAALKRLEQGGEDFWTLIRVHQARAVIFDAFQVLRSFERSHDDALHCRLNG